jgi:Bifunctional DNA primase/polymerase, N-terminal
LSREELARAAAALTETGLSVFPCLVSGAPATSLGSSVDRPDRAYRLFRGTPDAALIGVPTGSVTMLLVIDVDPKALLWFRPRVRRFPVTRMHQTPRGGWHLVYRLPLPPAPLLGSSAGRLAPGVDTRGEGGYVIWPPSDGYGVVHEGEVARLPKWIVRRLTMALRRPRRAEYVSIGQQRVEALANFVVHSRRGEPAARALWAASQAREVVEAGKIGEREARATIARAAMAAGVDSAPSDEELARAGALEAAEDGRLRDLGKGHSFHLAATQNIDRVIADSVPTGRRRRYG